MFTGFFLSGNWKHKYSQIFQDNFASVCKKLKTGSNFAFQQNSNHKAKAATVAKSKSNMWYY